MLQESYYFTDGGLETTLLFHEGVELPEFSVFQLFEEERYCQWFAEYLDRYVEVAREHGSGFILQSPTWRASSDWADKLGVTRSNLEKLNAKAIALLIEYRSKIGYESLPMLVSGCVGPRFDGYQDSQITVNEAREYHMLQLETFAEANVDLITAMTLTNEEEAIGLTSAATACGLSAVISFTVETDGKLPNGRELRDAIGMVDECNEKPPLYYMINCAHPEHFMSVIRSGGSWLSRLGGLRSNASTLSHEELDGMTELDDGDPASLGLAHREFAELVPHARVFGGCCGTDERHVRAIAETVCRKTP